MDPDDESSRLDNYHLYHLYLSISLVSEHKPGKSELYLYLVLINTCSHGNVLVLDHEAEHVVQYICSDTSHYYR